jgi:hypothetical protein
VSIVAVLQGVLEHFPQQLFEAVFFYTKNLLQIDPSTHTLFLGHGISSVSTDFGDLGRYTAYAMTFFLLQSFLQTFSYITLARTPHTLRAYQSVKQ